MAEENYLGRKVVIEYNLFGEVQRAEGHVWAVRKDGIVLKGREGIHPVFPFYGGLSSIESICDFETGELFYERQEVEVVDVGRRKEVKVA